MTFPLSFSAFFHGSFFLILLVHPLLRGCWDLWAQTAVRLACCGLLMAAALRRLAGPKQDVANGPERVLSQTALPLGLFLGGSAVSAALSPFAHSVDRALLNDAVGFAFFYLLAAAPAERREFHLKALWGGTVLVLAAALVSAKDALGPLSGPLVNPNVLASFLLLAAPLVLRHWADAEALLPRLLRAAAAAALVWCLFRTSSFLAYLVLALQASLLFALLVRERARIAGRLRVFGFLVPALLLSGAWIFRAEWPRLLQWEGDRAAWAQSGLRMWMDKPLWGQGPGAFGEAYPGYRADPWGQNSLYAHNFLLEMLAERGAVSAAGFLLFLVLLARRCRRGLSGNGAAAALGLAGFGLYNLAHIGFSFPSPAWAFWSLAGYLWGESPEEKTAARETPGPRWPLPAAGLVLGALTAAWSFGLFRADQHLARGRYAWQNQDPATAGASAEQGLRWNPREPELYSLRARARLAAGQKPEAEADLQKSLSLSPFSARFHQEAGELSLGRGDLPKSLASFERAISALPLNPLSWLRRAQVLESLGRRSEALETYERILMLTQRPDVLAERDETKTELARLAAEKIASLQ